MTKRLSGIAGIELIELTGDFVLDGTICLSSFARELFTVLNDDDVIREPVSIETLPSRRKETIVVSMFTFW